MVIVRWTENPKAAVQLGASPQNGGVAQLVEQALNKLCCRSIRTAPTNEVVA